MIQNQDSVLFNALHDKQPTLLLIGGSYDPPHRLHLALAYAAGVQLVQDLLNCKLERTVFCATIKSYWLVFWPSRQNPLKAPLAVSGHLRLEMLAALLTYHGFYQHLLQALVTICAQHYATEQFDWLHFWQTALTVHLSPAECCYDLAQPSYTVDLVKLLRQFTPAYLALVIGDDNLMQFHAWHQPQQLLQLIDCLYVAAREKTEACAQLTIPLTLQNFPPELLAKFRGLSAFAANDLSSTQLRALISAGDWQRVADYTCPAIVDIIKQQCLYGVSPLN